MNTNELALREIRDRIAAAIGEMDEQIANSNKKQGHSRLGRIASDLHQCANEIQNLLMRVKMRGG